MTMMVVIMILIIMICVLCLLSEDLHSLTTVYYMNYHHHAVKTPSTQPFVCEGPRVSSLFVFSYLLFQT